MRRRRSKSQLLWIWMVVGFFAGILYRNLRPVSRGGEEGLLSVANLKRFQNTRIVQGKYLWYVVKARLITVGVMVALGFVKYKKAMAVLVIGLFSFLGGVFAVSAVLGLGVRGILLCVAGIMPQIIFYGLGAGILLRYWYFYPTGTWNSAKTLFVGISLVLGVLTEAYVSPGLVKWVITRFLV